MNAPLVMITDPVDIKAIAVEVLEALSSRTQFLHITFKSSINFVEQSKTGRYYSTNLPLSNGHVWEIIAFQADQEQIRSGISGDRGTFPFDQPTSEKVFQLLTERYEAMRSKRSVQEQHGLRFPR